VVLARLPGLPAVTVRPGGIVNPFRMTALKTTGGRALSLLAACTGLAFLACAVIFLAAHCCHRDAARLAWQREFVRMAAARRHAGMAADHPEDPGPPGDWESLMSGGDYAWFAAQLSDIEVKP
jgi:hypothetical protein